MDSTTIEWEKPRTNIVQFVDTNNTKPGPFIIKTALSKRIRKQQQEQLKNERASAENNSSHAPFGILVNQNDSNQSSKPIKSILKRKIDSTQQIEIFKEQVICSSRGIIATFIIAALLFIAAGVSAGVVFTTIKSDNSSSSNNINQNLVIATSTQLPMSTIITGSQSGSPCSPSTYTSINDPSRNYNYSGSQGSCDRGYPFVTSNGGAWIRFEGSGGTTIPTWSVDVNHCGAYLGVWSNSTLPTIMNVLMNVTLCYSPVGGDCFWGQDAPVIYCPGNYYIYFLPPVIICTARYCTA